MFNVYWFDTKSWTFAVVRHNMNDLDATLEKEKMRREGINAFMGYHEKQHATGAEICEDCQQDIVRAVYAKKPPTAVSVADFKRIKLKQGNTSYA